MLPVCIYKEFIFFIEDRCDTALSFPWPWATSGGVGSSGRRIVAAGTQALAILPSAQCCRSSSFSIFSLLQGPLGRGPQLSFLFSHCSHIISCKTFIWRNKLILATINSHCNLFRIRTVSINRKGSASIKQHGSY